MASFSAINQQELLDPRSFSQSYVDTLNNLVKRILRIPSHVSNISLSQIEQVSLVLSKQGSMQSYQLRQSLKEISQKQQILTLPGFIPFSWSQDYPVQLTRPFFRRTMSEVLANASITSEYRSQLVSAARPSA
jgi:hypothetical protein